MTDFKLLKGKKEVIQEIESIQFLCFCTVVVTQLKRGQQKCETRAEFLNCLKFTERSNSISDA